ncbi:SDR family oxidoreductase [Candidatus Woesebacteria bacterium]|nr:MAG: SDR family oxidoreductase [Candidatus Woesebacteria bacterium]
MNLKNKTAVITGATGGIGSVLSVKLAQKGVKLILLSRTESKLKDLIDRLDGDGHEYIQMDATKTQKVKETAEKILGLTEKIDILVNAAGVGVYKSLEDAGINEWEDSVAINVTTPFYLTKELLPHLKKSEDSVVINVGSGMGKIPTPCRSVYCATKYALRGMTLSLAAEYHGSNIHFVHIDLGSTLTDFGPLSLEDKIEENLRGKSYFTPSWVADKFIAIIEKDEYEAEITLYPSDYK